MVRDNNNSNNDFCCCYCHWNIDIDIYPETIMPGMNNGYSHIAQAQLQNPTSSMSTTLKNQINTTAFLGLQLIRQFIYFHQNIKTLMNTITNSLRFIFSL